jgi:hypothetical protein
MRRFSLGSNRRRNPTRGASPLGVTPAGKQAMQSGSFRQFP